MDGAFFPQPDFQVPEKEMGQHAGYDVVWRHPGNLRTS